MTLIFSSYPFASNSGLSVYANPPLNANAIQSNPPSLPLGLSKSLTACFILVLVPESGIEEEELESLA